MPDRILVLIRVNPRHPRINRPDIAGAGAAGRGEAACDSVEHREIFPA